jgi:hypothetical protein
MKPLSVKKICHEPGKLSIRQPGKRRKLPKQQK